MSARRNWPGRSRAHYRDYDEPADHGEHAGVDGVFEYESEEGDAGDGEGSERYEQLHRLEPDAEDERGGDGGLGDVLAVEPVEEGGEERSGESAPGNAHHLGDEDGLLPDLKYGDGGGDDDEDGYQDSYEAHLALLGHALFAERLYKIEGHGRGARQHQRRQSRHGGRED